MRGFRHPTAELKDRCEVWAVNEDRVARARKRLLDNEACASIAETFAALADPNRTKILCSLCKEELCVCDLACLLRVSESAVSQHLRILRSLGLVRQRKEGRMMYYSLGDDHVHQLLETCVEHIKHG